MKITILNASPRPKGNISTMLHTMEEELLANGAHMRQGLTDREISKCRRIVRKF